MTEIAVVPQEYVYKRAIRKEKEEIEKQETGNPAFEFFSIIRYDFVATICTGSGEYKKALIEIQKSRKYTELVRFRNYLGEQYKRVDVINTKTGEVEKMLSVFEQQYFIDEKEIVKTYEHQVDNEIIKEMLDILRNVAADPEEMKSIEAEWLAIKDEEGYEQALQTIAEQGNTIATLQNEKSEQGKTITEQAKELAAQAKEFAALKRRFGIDPKNC